MKDYDFVYIDIDENPIVDPITPEMQLIKAEELESIGSEAKKLLQIILESPAELMGLYKRKKSKRNYSKEISPLDIQLYAEKKMGMTIRHAREVVKELKEFANG